MSAPEVGKHTPGPAGSEDLRALGVDYFYDPDDWESTLDADDSAIADEMVGDSISPWEPHHFVTLITGPTLYAARIATELTPEGDVEDFELRWFASEADARAAIAKATALQDADHADR